MIEHETPWLRFNLFETRYAIPLSSVAEVTEASIPRMIPLVPLELGGVVNVRGEPLPVVDGGMLLESSSRGPYRQILVLENEGDRIGVLVGQVSGLERGLSTRSVDEADEPDESVRWVIQDRERTGLVDADNIFSRAKELLRARP